MPRTEYQARLRKRREEAALHRRNADWISHARLMTFAGGAAMAWFTWGTPLLSSWWMVLPASGFLVLVFIHDRALRRLWCSESAVDFYENGLARLENRWSGRGDAGDRFLPDAHPYARDLDLFGRGSLFELLSTATTSWGAKTLADWLLSPASRDEILSRHAAVEELAPRLDLREEIATRASAGRGAPQVDPEALTRWASAPPVLGSDWRRHLAIVLAVFALASITMWLASMTSRLPVLAILLIEATLAFSLRDRVSRVLGAVEKPARDLAALAELLAVLERESFSSPRLIALQRMVADGVPASQRVKGLRRRIDFLDARRNQMFAPLAALMLWGTQFAFVIESWRIQWGGSVPRWLDATGELEALVSLASHAYEHPQDSFPAIVDEGPLYEADAIGHPLIPEGQLVRNDLRLGGELRLLVVSGSNMSGKSTLLRTVGVNAVLALAGAPVRAKSLRLSPFALGASIRVQDSLQEGISRFYAEITHLRQIMELAEGDLPLLFLLDEILQGTNSHDRRVGADGLVRGLLERGAVGLVTTHDLALAKIADSLSPRAANVHFEDHLEDGRMSFSYRMQPGVVRKSNALALMRAVGLKV
ncbi:MAG TPA: DNA mismatch repair protein MutS [Vicinamibacteria bacterium]